MKIDKNIEFVAKHYRKGYFSVDKGWKRLGIVKFWNWRRLSAAIAIGVVVLSAAAYMVYDNYYANPPQGIEESVSCPAAQALEVKVIDFENAPLPTVVKRIEATYSVRISNMPSNAEIYSLSLRYEGNVYDLIDTINDILELQLEVEEL